MSDTKNGRLTVVTRRYVQVCDENYQQYRGMLQSASGDPCVGDLVQFQVDERGAAVVTKTEPRRNLLSRSNGHKTKLLAANIDLLLIVVAPLPLFNTIAVDRVLAVAHQQGIATRLVCNKSDLEAELAATADCLSAYEALGDVSYCSAITGQGVEELRAILTDPELHHVVITGVSGVGKSSILNQLIPEVDAVTQTVSDRTGQGRQTTSQAIAHQLPRGETAPLLLCDLPGVQSFGVCHLEEAEIRAAFTDFAPFSEQCRFANCSHSTEPECQVQIAVESGTISNSRFKSYTEMIEEVRAFDPYR